MLPIRMSNSQPSSPPATDGGPVPAADWTAVYDQLRGLAARRLASERAGHTLQATALVHEVYVKLAGVDPDRWADAGHFYAAAAEAMRHLLADHARARLAAKRGGGSARLPLTAAMASVATVAESADPDQVLALDHAVTRLDRVDADAAAVVRLRFYAGLSVERTAATLAMSPATVKRKWAYARAWLYRELSSDLGEQ